MLEQQGQNVSIVVWEVGWKGGEELVGCEELYPRLSIHGTNSAPDRIASRCLIHHHSIILPNVPFPFNKMPTINRKRRAVSVPFVESKKSKY